MNLPNALTLLRIFFVPLLVAALVQDDWNVHAGSFQIANNQVALAIFLLAAATDLVDGYLARRWRQITTVGTLLDPIADKLLISAALISLVEVRVVPAWMTVVVVGREFAVSGLRSIAAAEGYVIRANDWGKLKLVTQVGTIGLLMISQSEPLLRPTALIAMWVVLLFTIGSAFSYFFTFWKQVDIGIKRRLAKNAAELDSGSVSREGINRTESR